MYLETFDSWEALKREYTDLTMLHLCKSRQAASDYILWRMDETTRPVQFPVWVIVRNPQPTWFVVFSGSIPKRSKGKRA